MFAYVLIKRSLLKQASKSPVQTGIRHGQIMNNHGRVDYNGRDKGFVFIIRGKILNINEDVASHDELISELLN